MPIFSIINASPVITNSGMKYGEGEEAVDMCQAIQEMRMEERLIGEEKKAKEAAVNLYKLGSSAGK